VWSHESKGDEGDMWERLMDCDDISGGLNMNYCSLWTLLWENERVRESGVE